MEGSACPMACCILPSGLLTRHMAAEVRPLMLWGGCITGTVVKSIRGSLKFCCILCRILCVLFWMAVIAVGVAIFAVLLPKALAKPIQALINLLMRKLTRGQLIAIVIGAVALLPCTLVLPMIPFIWIAGKQHGCI